jgi:hypothetical protein
MIISRYLFLASMVALLAGGLAGAANADDAVARCGELPEPVAAKHRAILDAAETGDLEALAALADAEFTYSFGNGEGALAYWQRMRDEEGVDAAALIVGLSKAGCAQYDEGDDRFYVWPAAALIDYPDLNEGEIAALQVLYDDALESWYIEGFDVGYYVGWRYYFEPDGRWTAFVAGD